MASEGAKRINVVLDEEHAARLDALAARLYVQPGTIARSLLSTALHRVDTEAATITALLDAIPEPGSGPWKASPTPKLAESSRSIESDRCGAGRRHRSGEIGPGTTREPPASRRHSRPRPPEAHTARVVPLLGQRLTGRWDAFRVILDPWARMLIVYVHDDATNTVTVVAILGARMASSTSGP